MQITFQFNLQKAIQAASYFLAKIGPSDKVKLLKLIYLADRAHFIEHGVSITGDRLCAMKYGPLPSRTLSAINGDMGDPAESVYRFIHLTDHRVELRQSPGTALLSADEISTLDRILVEHGSTPTWKLVSITHQLPEYIESYVAGTSKTIPFERIAQFSGNPDRFRHGRPVISKSTASQMTCPFPPDQDL